MTIYFQNALQFVRKRSILLAVAILNGISGISAADELAVPISSRTYHRGIFSQETKNYTMGEQMMNEGKYLQAINCFKTSLRFVDKASYHIALGKALIAEASNKNDSTATQLYQEAIRNLENYPLAHSTFKVAGGKYLACLIKTKNNRASIFKKHYLRRLKMLELDAVAMYSPSGADLDRYKTLPSTTELGK